MELNLNHVIDQVSKDKGIERDALQSTLEQAILQAAKKVFGADRNIEAEYNHDEGVVELFQVLVVTDDIEDPYNEMTMEEAEEHGLAAELDEELLFQIFYLPKDLQKAREQDERYGDILQLRDRRGSFGRIAAQTAKQVITQRIREAERDNVYREYIDRKGELITGIVRRFERGNIIVDLGRAEAILPVREQVPRESYRPGDRIQAYVLDVQQNARGPQIVLSRTSPGLLIKLFEMEVPEIYEGIVRIETAAREPGSRAKIAVSSRDPDVDPVGACVGMKGSRVQAVVQELRGEKIDIVPYSEDPARFVCNAIQPAEVSRVLIDEDTFTMELIVPDDQLSQAIGRRGQNVRLASQLTGWKIDIHSESKIRELEEEARLALCALDGVTADAVDTLWRLGYRSLEHISNTSEEELANIPGITAEMATMLRAGAEDLMARREAGEDIRPAAELPEGYDPEIEWSRWPADEELLGRETFDACVRGGRFTLESIAGEDTPETLARILGSDVDAAVAVIYAAKDALATLESLSSAYGQSVSSSEPVQTDVAEIAEIGDSAGDEDDDATVLETVDFGDLGADEVLADAGSDEAPIEAASDELEQAESEAEDGPRDADG